jgi:hypothetical protein
MAYGGFARGRARERVARETISLSCQRRIERQPTHRTITVQLHGSATWFYVMARNVSAHGLGFRCTATLAIGDVVAVLTDRDAIPRPARVRYADRVDGGYDVGVMFDEPLPDNVVWMLTVG